MLKLVIFIISIWLIIGLGFIAFVFAAFSQYPGFYIPVVIVTALAMIVFLVLATFQLLGKKMIIITLTSFIVILGLTVGGHQGYQSYLASIPTVSEQDVNISHYKPFIEGSKAAALGEESTQN